MNRSGFTLLETMVALAIMVVAFASILMVESASLNTSMKARQLNVVSMLAKNILVETEYKFEGKTFEEFKKEDAGRFNPPFEDYSWKVAVKDLKFPSFSPGGEKSGEQGETDIVATMSKLVTNFLSKAIREVTVTISWKKGSGEQTFSTSTYWVNLNNEFQLSE
jgi:prepilin-type N-terminal cleavage/methylation domain-containing protein